MMIINKKTSQPLKKEDNSSYILYMDNRAIISPAQKYIIELPYFKDYIDNEYFLFEPDMYLIKDGLMILGHNFNQKESTESMKILIFNINMHEKLYEKKDNKNFFRFNEAGTVDLKPGTVLGKIFEIKQK